MASAAVAASGSGAGEDHPLFPRYPNAVLKLYRAPSLDEIVMPTGPIQDADGTANRQTVTGTVSHFDYAVRPAVSALQVARFYEARLRSTSYTIVFGCSSTATCGNDMGKLILLSGKVAPEGVDGLFGDKLRVIVARRDASWILLHIYEGPDRTIVYQANVDPEETAKPAATPVAAGAGPKVHTSAAKDVTDCTKHTDGGGRTATGGMLGGLLGSKVGGAKAVYAGAAVGGVIGDKLDMQARCGPSARVESNAAADDDAKPKKNKLRSVLGF
ncbi:hypothetical protein GCM10011380_18590 [Sphingomonas metalli]|uniref:Uncharacterized protein n=1 Tax=Sphingomonas metalli TaxID=1779358 RepID=A0A916T3B5_9SPHN|nr:hypothetical protein [Sphingomonas metalli]GGB29361.1 hypothetical protein GCM10011380_18590 [Sphingomonas metalli]